MGNHLINTARLYTIIIYDKVTDAPIVEIALIERNELFARVIATTVETELPSYDYYY